MNTEFNNATIECIIEKGFELTIKELISEGWELCKKTILYLIGFSMLLAIGTAIFFGLSTFFLKGIPIMIMIGFTYIFIFTGLFMGYYTFLVKAGKGEIKFGNFFTGFKFIGQLIIYYSLLLLLELPVVFFTDFLIDTSMSTSKTLEIIVFLIQVLTQGYALLLSLLFIFVFFLMADKDITCTKAMVASTKIIMNKFLYFILLGIGLVVVNIVGGVFIGIGLFLTLPFTFCVLYVLYKSIFVEAINSILNERISSFGNTK